MQGRLLYNATHDDFKAILKELSPSGMATVPVTFQQSRTYFDSPEGTLEEADCAMYIENKEDATHLVMKKIEPIPSDWNHLHSSTSNFPKDTYPTKDKLKEFNENLADMASTITPAFHADITAHRFYFSMKECDDRCYGPSFFEAVFYEAAARPYAIEHATPHHHTWMEIECIKGSRDMMEHAHNLMSENFSLKDYKKDLAHTGYSTLKTPSFS